MAMDVPAKNGREGQIIVLAAEGLTDKQIAVHLGIGVETVGTYWKRILSRFSSSSRTEVIARVLRQQSETVTESLREEIERRRVAEAQLERAVARLATLVGAIDAGVVLFNEDVQVIYVNDLFCQLFGVQDARELVGAGGTNLIEAISPAFVDPENMAECILELVKGSSPRRGRRHLLHNGNIVQSDYAPTVSDTQTRGHLFQCRDVTREVAEERLATLLARIAPTLISSIGHDVDTAIHAALREVCEFARADRAFVFQYNPDDGSAANTHEWNAEGIASMRNDLQTFPMGAYPWWMEHMQRNEPIVVNNVAEMPAEAAPEMEAITQLGVQSFIALPLWGYDGECLGFFGFHSIHSPRIWERNTADLLVALGDMLTATLQAAHQYASR